MHYKTRANIYMLLERGVVGSCFGVYVCPYLGGWGEVSHIGKSSAVARVFSFGMVSCQTSVILNRCVKPGFLVCMSFSVSVGGTELCLQISYVCWAFRSAAGQGWASVPL